MPSLHQLLYCATPTVLLDLRRVGGRPLGNESEKAMRSEGCRDDRVRVFNRTADEEEREIDPVSLRTKSCGWEASTHAHQYG